MPPHFPCKEHGDFESASQRRKHVNLLLLDGCVEYHRTYDASGWPRHPLQLPLKPRSIVAGKTAVATEPLAKAEAPAAGGATGVGAATDTVSASAMRKWTAAYAGGGQEAADIAKQVGSMRSPTGTFFGLTQPGRLRTMMTADSMQQPEGMSAVKATVPNTATQDSGFVGNATSTAEEREIRSWLMPHQTRNRVEGAKMANAVNSARTPIGAFADFDMSKAPAKA